MHGVGKINSLMKKQLLKINPNELVRWFKACDLGFFYLLRFQVWNLLGAINSFVASPLGAFALALSGVPVGGRSDVYNLPKLVEVRKLAWTFGYKKNQKKKKNDLELFTKKSR